jgi:hypothetical protein
MGKQKFLDNVGATLTMTKEIQALCKILVP